MNNTSADQSIRLQKYLSRCGVASRRHSEKLIKAGQIFVNKNKITKLGTKINPKQDIVEYNGKKIEVFSESITLMLNKPCGYISSMSDPYGRSCVSSLVPVEKYPNIFPVGRLDRLTCGILIFTTDGNLGQNLLHPKYECKKKYEVVILGDITKSNDSIARLKNGIDIGGFTTSKSDVEILEVFDFSKYQVLENKFFINCSNDLNKNFMLKTSELINKTFTRLNITIHEGKYHQIRRMFDMLGYTVLLLTRIQIGNLKLSNVESGFWVKLKKDDIEKMVK